MLRHALFDTCAGDTVELGTCLRVGSENLVGAFCANEREALLNGIVESLEMCRV